ncbi:MAG: DUF4355 domain-containing protein [Clostridiales bacterium]|jgi:hypothetical protein|nr:DUF4355 domain-containing protein [Clostridiales bacterium]
MDEQSPENNDTASADEQNPESNNTASADDNAELLTKTENTADGFDFDQFFANNQDNIKKALAAMMSNAPEDTAPQSGQDQNNAPESGGTAPGTDENQARKSAAEEKHSEREQQLIRKTLEAETRMLLMEKGIPAQFFDFIIDADLEKTTQKMDAFKAEFDSATKTLAQKMVKEAVKGRRPEGCSGGIDGMSSTRNAIQNIIRR